MMLPAFAFLAHKANNNSYRVELSPTFQLFLLAVLIACWPVTVIVFFVTAVLAAYILGFYLLCFVCNEINAVIRHDLLRFTKNQLWQLPALLPFKPRTKAGVSCSADTCGESSARSISSNSRNRTSSNDENNASTLHISGNDDISNNSSSSTQEFSRDTADAHARLSSWHGFLRQKLEWAVWHMLPEYMQQQALDLVVQCLNLSSLPCRLGSGGFASVWRIQVMSGGVAYSYAAKQMPVDPAAFDESGVSVHLLATQQRELWACLRLRNSPAPWLRTQGLCLQSYPLEALGGLAMAGAAGSRWYVLQLMDLAAGDFDVFATIVRINEVASQLPYDVAYLRVKLLVLLCGMRDVAYCLHELHLAGMVHADLKPANILYYYDAQRRTRVSLIDFGLVRNLAGQQLVHDGLQVGGTPAFAPHESLGSRTRQFTTFSSATDIYSIGLIFMRLLVNSDTALVFARTFPNLAGLLLACISRERTARPCAMELWKELELAIAALQNEQTAQCLVDVSAVRMAPSPACDRTQRLALQLQQGSFYLSIREKICDQLLQVPHPADTAAPTAAEVSGAAVALAAVVADAANRMSQCGVAPYEDLQDYVLGVFAVSHGALAAALMTQQE